MPKSPKRDPGRPKAEDDPRLRERNLCILAKRVAGKTVAQIAGEFGLSQRQIKAILAKVSRPRPQIHRTSADDETLEYHGADAPDHFRFGP